MSEAETRTRGRTFFDALAVATLVGFGAFVAIIMLCAACIPQLRDRARGRHLSNYRFISAVYDQLEFAEDDTRLRFRRIERYARLAGRESSHEPATEQEILDQSVTTGRCSVSVPAVDMMQFDNVVRALLRHYLLQDGIWFDPKYSHDRREIALAAEGVHHRRADDTWICVSGEKLPEAIEKAMGRPRSLESADASQWADAALGATLREGLRASVFADRLIRVHKTSPGEADALTDILLRMDGSHVDVMRVVFAADSSLQRRLVEGVQNRSRKFEVTPQGTRRPIPDPATRRALLGAAAALDWGAQPTDYAAGWALSALEDGTYADLDQTVRKGVLDRLSRALRPSYAPRLARVVETRSAVEGVAAYFILRAVCGEPANGEPTPDKAGVARTYVTELRARRPEIFREQ